MTRRLKHKSESAQQGLQRNSFPRRRFLRRVRRGQQRDKRRRREYVEEKYADRAMAERNQRPSAAGPATAAIETWRSSDSRPAEIPGARPIAAERALADQLKVRATPESRRHP